MDVMFLVIKRRERIRNAETSHQIYEDPSYGYREINQNVLKFNVFSCINIFCYILVTYFLTKTRITLLFYSRPFKSEIAAYWKYMVFNKNDDSGRISCGV